MLSLYLHHLSGKESPLWTKFSVPGAAADSGGGMDKRLPAEA